MPLGPGKYDDLCTTVRKQAGIGDKGGVIVIVFGGNKGNGFSCQADPVTTLGLPETLESIAKQIRNSLRA